MFGPLFRSRWLQAAGALAALAGLLVAATNWWLLRRARPQIFLELRNLPANDFAIVLGTSPKSSSGAENPFFTGRMAAAADLYHAGKVRHLLLSGDNGRREYDEPAAMREALVALGVPASALTVDDAGFRTLDTMARARRIFGVNRATIVTDDFHEARSLFLARAFGIEAMGYPSRPVRLRYSGRTRLREVAGRTVAWLDVYVLRTSPHFYGAPQPITLAGS